LEQTLILLKPDAVQRGLAGAILARLEGRGLKIVAMRMLHMDQALARRHYAPHVDKPFYPGLERFITSGPIVAAVLEGPGAVDLVRTTMGATAPAKAAPGTIRGDLAVDIGRNLIHGSDSPESAKSEIALYFDAGQILSYERSTDPWIVE